MTLRETIALGFVLGAIGCIAIADWLSPEVVAAAGEGAKPKAPRRTYSVPIDVLDWGGRRKGGDA